MWPALPARRAGTGPSRPCRGRPTRAGGRGPEARRCSRFEGAHKLRPVCRHRCNATHCYSQAPRVLGGRRPEARRNLNPGCLVRPPGAARPPCRRAPCRMPPRASLRFGESLHEPGPPIRRLVRGPGPCSDPTAEMTRIDRPSSESVGRGAAPLYQQAGPRQHALFGPTVFDSDIGPAFPVTSRAMIRVSEPRPSSRSESVLRARSRPRPSGSSFNRH